MLFAALFDEGDVDVLIAPGTAVQDATSTKKLVPMTACAFLRASSDSVRL